MRTRSLVVLTLTNLAILICSLATMRPAVAEGTSNTYIILESKDSSSSLKLRNEDGREQVVKP